MCSFFCDASGTADQNFRKALRQSHLQHLNEGDGEVQIHQVAKVQRRRHEQPNGHDLREVEVPRHHAFCVHNFEHLLIGSLVVAPLSEGGAKHMSQCISSDEVQPGEGRCAHPAAEPGGDRGKGHAEARQRHGVVKAIGGHQVLVEDDERAADAHPHEARHEAQRPPRCSGTTAQSCD